MTTAQNSATLLWMYSYNREFKRHTLSKNYRSSYLKVRLGNFLLKAAVAGILLGIVGIIFLFIWYSKDLPSPDKVQRKDGFSTVVLDRNEKPLYDIFTDKNRIPLKSEEIPDWIKKATVAIEDKDFYKHQGFDTRGMIRSLVNIITLRGLQGGSTLTQQLVKNSLLTSERSLPRKIREFVLSIQIERKYTKDQILQMYLNEAPYGGTMYGVESATQGYFGKHAKDLTLIESVILAGLPQEPSYYTPFGSYPKAYIDRATEVLRRMREDGDITPSQEAELKRDLPNVKFKENSEKSKAIHFVLKVRQELIDKFGSQVVDAGGLRVITTLDGDLQEKTETIVKEEVEKAKNLNLTNGAAVVIDPRNGEILAYVGSKDFSESENGFQGKFDVALMGLRQPGSALKPIAYAVGFTKGYNPSTLIMDVATQFPGGEGQKDYEPKNYDGKFKGPVQVRFAIGNSINVPAVKMTAMVGVPDILKTAYDMGLSTLAPTSLNERKLGLSLVLGGGEVKLIDLTSAYGVFATGGVRNDPSDILKVIDPGGNVIYEKKPVAGRRVLNEDVSFLVSHILLDNNARKDIFGPNSYLIVPGKTVGVKTGTTDDKKDNWTVGYTPSVVVGVWVGNNDNSAMNPKIASGVTGAAPIWNRIMKEALKDKKDEEFKKPDNVTSVTIDAFGGGLPKDGRPTRSEYFIKGTEPTATASIYKKLKVSKSDNNKLANAVEIANGQYDEKDFIVFEETDPTSRDGKNRWQEGIDQWLKTQSDPAYKAPHDTSTTDENTIVVRFKRPQDKSKLDDNSFDVVIEANANRDIKKMELYINDSLKNSQDNTSLMTQNITLDSGIYKLKAKAYDDAGHTGESEITIGIKTDPAPTDTPLSPSDTPTPALP